MNHYEAIKRSIQYIESNLYEDLSPKKLSSICHLSEFYFHRLFKNIIGISIMGYIQRRKLSEKTYTWAISQKNSSLLVLALDIGFSSQSAFTRAFKNSFQLTPTIYYKQFYDYKTQLYPPFNFFEYTMSTDPSIYDYTSEIVSLEPMLIIGKEISTSLSSNQNFLDVDIVSNETLTYENNITDFADESAPHIGIVYNATIDLSNSNNITFDYLRGYHVNTITFLPNEFVIKKIPKGRYIKFKTTSNEVVYEKTINYIFSEYLIKNKIDLTQYPIALIEKFRIDQLVDDYCVVELYLPYRW